MSRPIRILVAKPGLDGHDRGAKVVAAPFATSAWIQATSRAECRATDVPLVDPLALDIAAHEEVKRQALNGEPADREAAWHDADEIATIADALIS